MVDVIEITIEEFKKDIYSRYEKLFPPEEQREWKNVEDTYKKGVEKFYKITEKGQTVGFFMLVKLDDNHPFYLDYFAIFEEFQNSGYGTDAIKVLFEKIVNNDGLFGEIEKEVEDNPITTKRFEFYKRLGFEKVDSEYLLYKVLFIPIIKCNSKRYSKEEVDKIFFDYYRFGCGEEAVKKHCRIIK